MKDMRLECRLENLGSLDYVIGQKKAVALWEGILDSGTDRFAVLLQGGYGRAKTSFSRLVAGLFFCDMRREYTACGECSSCRMFRDLWFPRRFDLLRRPPHIVTPFGYVEIDSTRVTAEELEQILRLSRTIDFFSDKHLIVFDEFQRMTQPMRDKVLREMELGYPTSWVICVAETGAENIDAAVRGRCIQIALEKPNAKELLIGLQRLCREKALSERVITMLPEIIRLSDHTVRHCLQLIQEKLFLEAREGRRGEGGTGAARAYFDVLS